MTEIIKVIKEVVVVRSARETSVIRSTAQGLPGPRGQAGAGSSVLLKTAITVGGHRVCCPSPAGLIYADWNLPDTAGRVVGITDSAVDQGGEVQVRNYGEMTEPSWNWDITKPVYLGLNGVLTQVNPRTAGAKFSLIMGFPMSPKTLFITIRDPIFFN